MCGLIFSTTFISNTSLSKKGFSEILSYMRKRLHVKYPLFLSNFNKTWIFSTEGRKKAQMSNFIKICPVGKEIFHADGRTDMQKLTLAFRNFANASKTACIPLTKSYFAWKRMKMEKTGSSENFSPNYTASRPSKPQYFKTFILEKYIHSFIPQSVLRQVHSLFSTQCDLILLLSTSNTISFHRVI